MKNTFRTSIFILLIALTSCKTRKVNKEYSKSSDKTETVIAVKNSDSVTNNKETNLKIVEVSKDSSGTYTKKTKEYFPPNEKVPANSLKSETEETWNNNKSETKTNTDQSEFTNHSQITKVDSSFEQAKDVDILNKGKIIEAKGNGTSIWMGVGLLIGLVLFFIISKRREKF